MSEAPTPAAEILAFSTTQPAWMQDALRRVCLQPELTKKDYDELVALLKASASGTRTDSTRQAEPLRAEHLPARAAGAPQTVLASIGDIANANRLAPAQTLSFAIDGVTLIYGENGSGKSGYCRVLKKLCRVRDGADEPVLGDVFADAPAMRAQVKVRFREGTGQVQDPVWTDGSRPPSALSRISIFDSRFAPVYADQESRMEVLPYLMDVLPRLGGVVQEIERRIEADVTAYDAKLRTPLEPASAVSGAAGLIDRLQTTASDDTIPTEASIRAAAAWNDANEEELKQIEEDLATDAGTRASGARTTARAWTSLAEQLLAVDSQLCVAAIDAVQAQIRGRDAATAAAALAASEAFSAEPLRGAGSDAWLQMFRYAREYSAAAYPEVEFPVTGPDSRCVLCQQELQGDARQRLRRFDEFVRNTASEEATRQVAVVEETAWRIVELQVPSRITLDQVISPRPGLDPALAATIRAYCGEAERVKHLVGSGLAGGEAIPRPCGLGASPAEDLRSAASRLADEAARLDELALDPMKQAVFQARRLQLTGMKSLAPRVDTLLARRTDLEARRVLRAAKSLCNTRAISKANTDLRRQFLTREFCARLTSELKSLGLNYLPVEVTDRSERGANFIGVGLQTVVPILSNRAILSEGEFRGLALATFLAEIGGYGDQHGIVVDDPVSSLDHRHRRQVADRLVAEAGKGRQVIVFTHDLAFFHEMHEAAIAATPQVRVLNHEVRSTQQGMCGFVFADDEPWIAKSVKKRIGNLKHRLPELRKCAARSSEDYRKLAQEFRADLRQTWERLVEECLFNQVVMRFQPGVQTLRLKGVVVENEDYRRIFVEMAKCSRNSGHDRARGLQQSEPTPDELAADVTNMEKYLDAVVKRAERVQRERRKLEDPPPASVL